MKRYLITLLLIVAAFFSFGQTNGTFNNLDVRKTTRLRGAVYLDSVKQANRFFHILHWNHTTHQVEWMSPQQLADSLTIYDVGFWLRDTTNGEIYPKDLTDQVGIGTPDPSEMIDVVGNIKTSGTYKIGSTNVLKYTALNGLFVLAAGNDTMTGWHNIGIGNNALTHNSSGTQNFAFGQWSMQENTTGYSNVALGDMTLQKNTTGDQNEAVGESALRFNISGDYNSAIGYDALGSNISGNSNIAIGYDANFSNTTGDSNVSIGAMSLFLNDTGRVNTAVGSGAGYSNLGDGNVFLGYRAGYYETGNDKLYIHNSSGTPLIGGDFSTKRLGVNIASPTAKLHVFGNATTDDLLYVSNDKDATKDSTFNIDKRGYIFRGADPFIHNYGPANTVMGIDAGNFSMSTGYNCIYGYHAAQSLSSGSSSVFIGVEAGISTTTPPGNNFIGYRAGYLNETGNNNEFIGAQAGLQNVSGHRNLYIGSQAGYSNTGSDNIFLGFQAGFNTVGSKMFVVDYVDRGSAAADSTASFIWGNMSAMQLGLNAKVGIKNVAPDSTLTVTGSGHITTNLKVDGFINLPTTSATVGQIKMNGVTFLHKYGTRNIFFGTESGNFTLSGATDNFASGYQTLKAITDGDNNIAIGYQAGLGITSGLNNIAIGISALKTCSANANNIAIGYHALEYCTAANNVAIGYNAGANITATGNTLIGYAAASSSTTASQNTIIGHSALASNVTGDENTAVGYLAGTAATGTGNIWQGVERQQVAVMYL
jgi:hypothetical protein